MCYGRFWSPATIFICATVPRKHPQETRVHAHRTPGRHRHHCDPGGDASAGADQSQGESQARVLQKSDLRQIGVGLQVYAGDNADVLPRDSAVGSANALWDLPKAMADGLAGAAPGQANNQFRNIYYCPSCIFLTTQNADYWWNYSSGHRVTGYQWMISRDGSQTYGTSLYGPRGFITKMNRPYTNSLMLASSEIVSDMVPSQGSQGGPDTDPSTQQ